MAGYFSVKNYDKFQHYKDRNPPWIKFYNTVLDDYELGRLPDASKAHLFAIMLLASRYSNLIPYDAEWIARRINATDPVDLDLLTEKGFIIPDQDCSKMLASRYQNACLETETETERETEKREVRASAKRGSRLSPDWTPSEQNIAFCLARGMTEDAAHAIGDQFRDYWIAQAGQKGTKLDWDATWRNWVRRDKQFNGIGRKPSAKRQDATSSVEIAAEWAAKHRMQDGLQ